MEEKYIYEKRHFQRIDVSFWVEYTLNNELAVQMNVGSMAMEAQALDLSEGGIAILTGLEIPVLSIVNLRFDIPLSIVDPDEGPGGPIKVEGEVRYNFFVKDKNAYRIGISFINLSNEGRRAIADFVRVHLS
jgi:c-di-GMP-binding flagellar brake protein YcgR